MPERFVFIQDDSYHWYIIRVEDIDKFRLLLEESDKEDYDEFDLIFGKKRIDGCPMFYSFENPKRIAG